MARELQSYLILFRRKRSTGCRLGATNGLSALGIGEGGFLTLIWDEGVVGRAFTAQGTYETSGFNVVPEP